MHSLNFNSRPPRNGSYDGLRELFDVEPLLNPTYFRPLTLVEDQARAQIYEQEEYERFGILPSERLPPTEEKVAEIWQKWRQGCQEIFEEDLEHLLEEEGKERKTITYDENLARYYIYPWERLHPESCDAEVLRSQKQLGRHLQRDAIRKEEETKRASLIRHEAWTRWGMCICNVCPPDPMSYLLIKEKAYREFTEDKAFKGLLRLYTQALV